MREERDLSLPASSRDYYVGVEGTSSWDLADLNDAEDSMDHTVF